MNEIKVEIISGKQKKDPSKTWKAVKVTIGDYQHIFFPKSSFETTYIESILNDQPE